jgi:uncharacterized protein YcbX
VGSTVHPFSVDRHLVAADGLHSPRLASSGPADGDVLVAPDDREPGRFTIAQVPGAAQVSAASQKAAVALARRFARRVAVDVWLTTDAGANTSRIHHYRRTRARAS